MKGRWVGVGWRESGFCGVYDLGLTTPPVAALWSPPPQGGRGARSSGVGGQRSEVGGQGSEVRGRRSEEFGQFRGFALPSLARRGGPRLRVVGWLVVTTPIRQSPANPLSRLPMPTERLPCRRRLSCRRRLRCGPKVPRGGRVPWRWTGLLVGKGGGGGEVVPLDGSVAPVFVDGLHEFRANELGPAFQPAVGFPAEDPALGGAGAEVAAGA